MPGARPIDGPHLLRLAQAAVKAERIPKREHDDAIAEVVVTTLQLPADDWPRSTRAAAHAYRKRHARHTARHDDAPPTEVRSGGDPARSASVALSTFSARDRLCVQLVRSGYSMRAAAEIAGVSHTTVWRALNEFREAM